MRKTYNKKELNFYKVFKDEVVNEISDYNKQTKAIIHYTLKMLLSNVTEKANANSTEIITEENKPFYSIKVKDDGIGFESNLKAVQSSIETAKQSGLSAIIPFSREFIARSGNVEINLRNGKITHLLTAVKGSEFIVVIETDLYQAADMGTNPHPAFKRARNVYNNWLANNKPNLWQFELTETGAKAYNEVKKIHYQIEKLPLAINTQRELEYDGFEPVNKFIFMSEKDFFAIDKKQFVNFQEKNEAIKAQCTEKKIKFDEYRIFINNEEYMKFINAPDTIKRLGSYDGVNYDDTFRSDIKDIKGFFTDDMIQKIGKLLKAW